MIRIDFPEPTDPDWQEWRHACDDATRALIQLIESGQKPQIKRLYKDERMKRIYKSAGAPFYGKCAYCESDIDVNHPGDIEHWRPKGRLTDQDGQPVQVMNPETDTVEPHPGYYWLAYQWKNLLFACYDCNQPTKAKTPGRTIGKWAQFPVREFRAVRPGEEEQEEPLLINPMDEDPSDHLEVDETGILIAKTDRGRSCIDIFGLNDREALVNARRKCIEDTKNKLLVIFTVIPRKDEEYLSQQLSDFKKIKMGEVPFSAAGRMALLGGKDTAQRIIDAL